MNMVTTAVTKATHPTLSARLTVILAASWRMAAVASTRAFKMPDGLGIDVVHRDVRALNSRHILDHFRDFQQRWALHRLINIEQQPTDVHAVSPPIRTWDSWDLSSMAWQTSPIPTIPIRLDAATTGRCRKCLVTMVLAAS